jgi:hypothetical protein
MGLFDNIFGNKAAEDAAAASRASLAGYSADTRGLYNQYQTSSLGTLGTARDAALGELGPSGALGAGQAAVDAYAPLSALGSKYGAATTRLLNALGVNGPGAFDTSVEDFRKTPGYQFQIDEANRNLLSKASQAGGIASGRTLQDLSERGRSIADTTFNQNYLQPLSQFINPELSATSGAATGISGANRTLADIYGSRAGVQSGFGQNAVDVFGNTVQGQAQVGRDVTQGNIAANNQVAQGAQHAADNFWNFLGSGAKAVGAAYGKV